MGVTRRLAVVDDPRFRDHRGPEGHPERPERLEAVSRAIRERAARLQTFAPRPAQDEEILRVHTEDHLDRLIEAARHAPLQLDPDTYVCPESLDVARLAAGTSIDLAGRVAGGEIQAGLVAVRPPGHHAEAGRAMGFCLLNHVAIAARALQRNAGVERVLIVDWDVHHGNGTQHAFEDDPSVLYFSTHQFPYYPGTGAVGEVGRAAGTGATVNVPLPAGCGDPEYLGVMERILVPVARRFRPEFILVSCGFDAHRDDPLAAMQVTGAGFAAMGHIVRALADDLCAGRLLLVLEGGYALSGLYEGTGAALDALLAVDADPPPPPETPPGSLLATLLEKVRSAHGGRYPELGAP
jgi:acetoin utilization deacetylase AcuC-like enzyme